MKRKDALARRRRDDLDAIVALDHGATRFHGFDLAVVLLEQHARLTGDHQVCARARRFLSHAADVAPRALLCHTYKHEVGASVVVRASLLAGAGYALRDVETFREPVRADGRPRLCELLRWLFMRYDAPLWTLHTLLRPPTTMVVGGGVVGHAPAHAATHLVPPTTFPHVAQGGRWSDAGAALPIEVTRRVARALAESTASHVCAPRHAVRAAQLRAYGVDDGTAALVARFIADAPFGTPAQESFLARFFGFIARPDIRAAIRESAVAHLCRFALTKMRTAPAFSFAGRTAKSLLAAADVEAPWYRADRRHLGALPRSGIAGGAFVTHRPWLVRPLESGAALEAEGLRMRHCVARYSCVAHQGKSAIFSAVPEDKATPSSTAGVTVEVRLPARVIVQVKGFANRAPTPEELAVLRVWANAVGVVLPGQMRAR